MPERRLQKTREAYDEFRDDPIYRRYVQPVRDMLSDTPKGKRMREEYEARLRKARGESA